MDIKQAKALENEMLKKFPSLWTMKYKTIKGKPTTFTSSSNARKNRPFQRAILDDDHPDKIIQKGRQLGLSEVGVSEVLHFMCNYPDVKVMYLFPRKPQMLDFSKSRVAPCFQDSPKINSYLDPANNSVSTKRINTGYLFMRSGWGSELGEGADIDMLNIDEYDRMKDGVEIAFQEGLSASAYGKMRRWSTPTLPMRGVNKQFYMSDQRRYFHTCQHCGHKQYLNFEKNVIQVNPKGVNKVTKEIEPGTFIIGCSKCKKELNRWVEGEYVAEQPSVRGKRGYMISQLDATWISADEIMKKFYTYNSRQLFYNYVIGEPYASEGLAVATEDLRKAVRLPQEIMSRNKTYAAIVAGIDWGVKSYMGVLGIRHNGQIDLLNLYMSEDDPRMPLKAAGTFAAILRAYNPNLVVCDSGYGADKNSYLYTQFPKALYSCTWTTTKSADSPVRFKDSWNEKGRTVHVDKTVSVQRVLHSFKNHLIGLFPWNDKLEELSLHLKNTQIMDEEEDGLIYQKATRLGPDHYVSALAYGLIGVNKLTNYNTIFQNEEMNVSFI